MRLAERARQLLDAAFGDPRGVHLEEALLDRRRQRQARSTPSRPAAIITAKARYVFEDGSGQRTSARVPSMDLPGRDHRHADQRRAVGPAPGDVGRRLVARHQALVAS